MKAHHIFNIQVYSTSFERGAILQSQLPLVFMQIANVKFKVRMEQNVFEDKINKKSHKF